MLGPASSENEGAGSGTGRVRAISLVTCACWCRCRCIREGPYQDRHLLYPFHHCPSLPWSCFSPGSA